MTATYSIGLNPLRSSAIVFTLSASTAFAPAGMYEIRFVVTVVVAWVCGLVCVCGLKFVVVVGVHAGAGLYVAVSETGVVGTVMIAWGSSAAMAAAPRWALVDEQNNVIVFVTPQAGVNLAPLVGQQVTVRGAKGFMPEYKRPYLVAAEARTRIASAPPMAADRTQ